MSDWNDIESIPRDRHVTVQTVTGLICRAKVQRGATIYKRSCLGYHRPRIACFGPRGDIMAIRWREVSA